MTCQVIWLGATVATPALAQTDVITIPSIIPYASEQVGNEAIRSECDWNQQLSRDIVNLSNGVVAATNKNLGEIEGRTLAITVTDVHAVGGGIWSGPKWGKLHGELSHKGKVLASFDMERRGINTPYSVCATLSNIARALSKDIVKWIGENQKSE